jgi:hypothetical protein
VFLKEVRIEFFLYFISSIFIHQSPNITTSIATPYFQVYLVRFLLNISDPAFSLLIGICTRTCVGTPVASMVADLFCTFLLFSL